MIIMEDWKNTINSRKEYKKNSILSSYLIHVENEALNILMKLNTDTILRSIIAISGYNILKFEIAIQHYITTLKKLINLLKVKL